MILILVTNHAFAQSQPPHEIVGLLSMTQFGNIGTGLYFMPGQQIHFGGNTLDNTEHTQVGGATVDLILIAPNGTSIKVASTVSDNQSNYSIDMPVTSGFEIGEYVATISVHKEGYASNMGDNSAIFFLVPREETQVIVTEGQEFPIHIWSIELKASNVTFNKETKSINFDLEKIPGNFVQQNVSGYNRLANPNYVFFIFKKPLISAPLNVTFNGQYLNARVKENSTYYVIDSYLPDSQLGDKNHLAIIGTYVIPEFSTIFPVLLISMVSLIIFCKINIRK
jgi:hypothetical protein